VTRDTVETNINAAGHQTQVAKKAVGVKILDGLKKFHRPQVVIMAAAAASAVKVQLAAAVGLKVLEIMILIRLIRLELVLGWRTENFLHESLVGSSHVVVVVAVVVVVVVVAFCKSSKCHFTRQKKLAVIYNVNFFHFKSSKLFSNM
jgi:hypothetical protein